jgi:hypothetical protein
VAAVTWWLGLEFLAGVAVGWYVEEARQMRVFRRALGQLYPPIANTTPPTTCELHGAKWVDAP